MLIANIDISDITISAVRSFHKQRCNVIRVYLWVQLKRFQPFTIPIKPLRTVLAVLSFKVLTQAYLVKTFMTHNK